MFSGIKVSKVTDENRQVNVKFSCEKFFGLIYYVPCAFV